MATTLKLGKALGEGPREQAFSYTQPFILAYSNTVGSFQIALHF
jgi:hypothetical protein